MRSALTDLIRLAFIFMLFSLALPAQDTLIKTCGDTLRVSLLEINPRTVKYSKPDNPGPVYVIDKNELKYIKYKNGQVDTIIPQPVAATAVSAELYDTIAIKGKKYLYKGKLITNRDFVHLIENYPDPVKRDEMLAINKKMRRNSRNRVSWAIAGLALIPVGAGQILAYASLGDDTSATPLGLIYGTTSVIAFSVSQVCNYRYYELKKENVEIFNSRR